MTFILAPGMVLGPYEIVATLGRGGMGEVYRARDPRLHRDVAIKVLPHAEAGDDRVQRFRREARAASALNHPHICTIYDVGEDAGRPYLVMELVEGRTLADLVAAGPVDVETTIRLGAQIADALAAAHARGIVHRDIKPANIMLAGGRHVKVLDFGLARRALLPEGDDTQSLTNAGILAGTPHYMPPEVLEGGTADAGSDVWALGVVLYQLASGRLPFTGSSGTDVWASILRDSVPPLPPEVPAALRQIIGRCLVKRPVDRTARSEDVREALLAIDRSAPIAPRLTPTGAPASTNADANDAFALAMHFQRVQNDMPRSRTYLERALALDPHFAEARRYHAFLSVLEILNGYTNDAGLLYVAEEELRMAERDDPALASLPSAFAAVYLMQGRKHLIPKAALDRETTQLSAARDALLWGAIVAWMEGDADSARALVMRSIEREPLFGAARMIFGELLRNAGDAAGAVREQRRVLEQAHDNVSAIHWLSTAYLDAGDVAQARDLLETSRPSLQTNYLWRVTHALTLAVEGRRDQALREMDAEALRFGRAAFVSTLDVAEFHAVLGETASALEWLDIAVRQGDERTDWFRRNPRLAALRDLPRFRQILDSIDIRRAR